ncbi:hypothetical protein F5883DRAFT_419085 [Diaporthe sp. PMI_573]|nr:hypothetical protein F5883DRAFT_419085 [Diaporthaceae sp. PMI_573]
MEVIPEVKACESCAKSKRKCGKESPRCHRCSSRDLECIYPLPTRPSSFVRLQDAPMSSVTSIPMVPAEVATSIPMLARPSALLPVPYSPIKQLSTDWFMSPDSWRIDYDLPPHTEPVPPSPYSRVALKAFLTTGQGWLSDWISTGGTTFIHKQLYSFQLPRCVQDAYTAVALYLLRTDENEDMVHRTIEDRSAQLLVDEEKHTTSSSLNPFGHLSRVHALLAYQIICLLDGDIRLRALAEERIPIMRSWLKQMLESVSFASQLTPLGATGAMTAARGLGLGICHNPSSQEEVLWHAWIFAESVRRTWIFSEGLHTVYHVMLQGWSTCCGALKFTTAAQVWDAPSSYAWSKICLEKNVALSEPEEVENFLEERRPEDVDDFAKSLLQIMFGKAKMERWIDAKTPVVV